MASRFPSESKVQLKARKGHDMKWSCDKHAEPIAFQCKTHTISICHRCATKDHGQKPCALEDIEDVILKMRRKLEDTQTKIAAAKKRLKTLRSKLDSSETSACNHLQSVNGNVNAAYEGKLNSVKHKEQDEIRLINEEADEEIRKINEKRETRIKACKEQVEKQQKNSKEIQAKLLSELNKIDLTVRKVIEDLKSKNQHEINTMDNLDSKIERFKQDDKTLVQEGPQLIASLDESLSSNVHQEVADCLERINQEFQRVMFVEGEVGGEHYGRIDGYIGKWELVKSVDIPLIVNFPRVRGLISDNVICVRDFKRDTLYVTDISTEHTQKVTEVESCITCVTPCAPVDSNIILCGKSDGYITLCSRQWKVLRDIPIPRNTSYPYPNVYVDVDSDGMILAAEHGQSNIYVINPADGEVMNTVTMQDKTVYNAIQALSSGDIVVQTDEEVLTVISRSGEEKAAIHCKEWEWSRCYVDKLTDTLYITYRDGERNVYAVDQVSRDGKILERRIVEYKQSDQSTYESPCVVTPSGNLVVCDAVKLLVYKRVLLCKPCTNTNQNQLNNEYHHV